MTGEIVDIRGFVSFDEVAQETIQHSITESDANIMAANDLIRVLRGACGTCGLISEALKTALVKSVGSVNTFGDEQLSVDVLAEKMMTEWAKGDELIKAYSSEENVTLQECHSEGRYVVCWDPLDGSSIVDCGWAVGTIIAIWEVGRNGVTWKGKDTLIGLTARQQVASILVQYGPRTSLILGVPKHLGSEASGTSDAIQVVQDMKGSILHLVLRPAIRIETSRSALRTFDDFEFCIVDQDMKIASSGAKIFAPANLRAAQDLPGYKILVDYWMEKRLTLRYTGGLVPDVFQLFIKKNGVFCNPASDKAPAKLRIVFEVAPIALLVELAGGKTSNGKLSILDVVISGNDMRSAFCCGTVEEVERFEREMLK